jgi:hypothetical protein
VFVRIETVGLVLGDDGARGQLQCIADATGGTYHDVGTIDVLAAELGAIAEAAVEGPSGFLLGGPTEAQATPLPAFWAEAEPPPDGDGMVLLGSGTYRIPIRKGQALWFSLALEDLQAASLYAVLRLPDGVAPDGAFEVAVRDGSGAVVSADRPGFGPSRSVISESPAVWATMEDVSDVSGGDPPHYREGIYPVTVVWDAPPAEVAGEVELTVEILEATGEYAEFILESRPPAEADEPETTTTGAPPPTEAPTTTAAPGTSTVATSTSVPGTGDGVGTAAPADPGSGDEQDGFPAIVIALAAVATAGAAAVAWTVRRRRR